MRRYLCNSKIVKPNSIVVFDMSNSFCKISNISNPILVIELLFIIVLCLRSVLGEDLVAIKLTANADKPRPLLKPLVGLICPLHKTFVQFKDLQF